MSDTKYEILSARLPFWERLRPNQKEEIYTNTRTARYKKGSYLSEVGEDCGVIIVKRGRICSCAVSEEGKEIALLCSYSGDICLLAAHAFIDTTPFNIHICAETEADVIIIDSQTLSEICKTNIYAQSFVSRLIAHHFINVVGGMQDMMFQSPEKRIVAFLCASSDRTGYCKVKATHEQIAKHVGTAREVVTRTLKKLSDSDILSLERGLIIIKDKPKLKTML